MHKIEYEIKLNKMENVNKNTELDNTNKKLIISDIMYSELREKFFHLIAGSFAHHEDDYPDVEIAADDAIEIVKEFIIHNAKWQVGD